MYSFNSLRINSSHSIGKWYECDKGKSAILKVPDRKIASNTTGKVCASGAESAWSGTEGAFSIYEASMVRDRADVELYRLNFDVPFRGNNKFEFDKFNTTSRPDLYGEMVLPGDLSQNNLPNSVVIISDKNSTDCMKAIELEKALENRRAFSKL